MKTKRHSNHTQTTSNNNVARVSKYWKATIIRYHQSTNSEYYIGDKCWIKKVNKWKTDCTGLQCKLKMSMFS